MGGIELRHVSKSFGKVRAISDLTLRVEEREFLTVLGPSGCGKTTTLRCLAGLEMPDSGEVWIGDRCVYSSAKGIDIAPRDRRVGLVFQNYALYPHMNVFKNVSFGLRNQHVPKPEIARRVQEVLEMVGLAGLDERWPRELSGGQQQRVAVARMVVSRPSIFLFDEPLSNLDVKLRVALRAELKHMHDRLGVTSVYVTHDQQEAMSLSDRIVVMNVGVIEQVGTPFQIYNFPETAFVAGFVGTLNTAIAEIADCPKGVLRLDSIQLLTADELTGKQNGDQVRIAIRPERFSFASEGKKPNIIDCKIENITFLGAIVRIQVLIGSYKFSMDTFNNPFLELPKIGEQTQITCSREAVLVLGDAPKPES